MVYIPARCSQAISTETGVLMLREYEQQKYNRLERVGIYVGQRALYILGMAGEAADRVPMLGRLLFGPKMDEVYRPQQSRRN